MAYQSISSGNSEAKKASAMSVGESLEGYVVRLQEFQGDYGEQTNIVFQDAESGDTFLVYTAGTLKYDARDGRIKAGLKTKITRLDDEKRTTKQGRGYTTSVFEVLQDPDDSIFSADASEASSSASDIKARANAVKEKMAK